MASEKKKGTGKARPGFVRGPWRARVDAIFVAWWSLRKRNQALGKIKDEGESKRQFDKWMKEAAPLSRKISAARKKIKDPVGAILLSEIARGMDSEGPDIDPLPTGPQQATSFAVNPESSPFFRQLVFMKYGITFRELIWQIDIEKTPAAHRKWMAVHRDYWRMNTVGPWKLKLKFNWGHFSIIMEGLDFGLDKLTPEELAECFDEICPCGIEHSSEYLKKVRTAIQKACARYKNCPEGNQNTVRC